VGRFTQVTFRAKVGEQKEKERGGKGIRWAGGIPRVFRGKEAIEIWNSVLTSKTVSTAQKRCRI